MLLYGAVFNFDRHLSVAMVMMLQKGRCRTTSANQLPWGIRGLAEVGLDNGKMSFTSFVLPSPSLQCAM